MQQELSQLAQKFKAFARVESQAHIEKSFYRADVVVDTGRPKDEVLEEIDKVIPFLLGGR